MTYPAIGGLLVDYGGTLVEELDFDVRAGNQWLLAHASYRPPGLTVDDVLDRARIITLEVAERRDVTHLEVPWSSMTRLIHDFLGVRFDLPMSSLEMGFWRASMRTVPMPGVRRALEHFRNLGIPLGVVSNTSFSEPAIRYELSAHGLVEYFDSIVVSAEYAVRKPNSLIFDTAAARLGVDRSSICFVGDRLDTDVAGAKAAGMVAAWFNRTNAEDPTQAADWIVADWQELVERIGPARSTGS